MGMYEKLGMDGCAILGGVGCQTVKEIASAVGASVLESAADGVMAMAGKTVVGGPVATGATAAHLVGAVAPVVGVAAGVAAGVAVGVSAAINLVKEEAREPLNDDQWRDWQFMCDAMTYG